jgi:sortase (surface protein transpeptidase)
MRTRDLLGLLGARVGVALGVAVLALPALAGCSASARQAAPTGSTAGGAGNSGGVEAARGFQPPRDYHATPLPVRIEIPKIHVDSALQRLGKEPDDTVAVPTGWDVAGWYALGPRPGDPGSAVILGHVDSTTGPAVFYRLRELRPGDEIVITRVDGSRVRFVVERIATYPKQRFPTDEVYYPTLKPTLRLVTCGGSFDFSTGHYRANVIVFATIKGQP